MRVARAQELQTEAFPALRIHLPHDELTKFLPVRMKSIDPLAEPEPSKGILLKLESGDYAVLVYGEVSETLTVLFPRKTNVEMAVGSFFAEVPIPRKQVFWSAPLSKQSAARHRRVPTRRATGLQARRGATRRPRSHRSQIAEPVER